MIKGFIKVTIKSPQGVVVPGEIRVSDVSAIINAEEGVTILLNNGVHYLLKGSYASFAKKWAEAIAE